MASRLKWNRRISKPQCENQIEKNPKVRILKMPAPRQDGRPGRRKKKVEKKKKKRVQKKKEDDKVPRPKKELLKKEMRRKLE